METRVGRKAWQGWSRVDGCWWHGEEKGDLMEQ